jgi:hypothetical protein
LIGVLEVQVDADARLDDIGLVGVGRREMKGLRTGPSPVHSFEVNTIRDVSAGLSRPAAHGVRCLHRSLLKKLVVDLALDKKEWCRLQDSNL